MWMVLSAALLRKAIYIWLFTQKDRQFREESFTPLVRKVSSGLPFKKKW